MIRKGALKKPERFLFGGFLPAAHRANRFAQPPWDFSVPGWQPLVLPEDIPDASTCIAEPPTRCKPLPCSFRVIVAGGDRGAKVKSQRWESKKVPSIKPLASGAEDDRREPSKDEGLIMRDET